MSDEVDLIDLTVRKALEPQLVVNMDVLRDQLFKIREEFEQDLEKLNVTREQLRSDRLFANLLIERTSLTAADLPNKFSVAKQAHFLTFEKSSPGVAKLLEHPEAGPYMRLRLRAKSALEESRLERIYNTAKGMVILSDIDEWRTNRAPLPVPLKYYGAHTGRWSGDGAINLQNLPRGSMLREAIEAPEGSLIITADLAQIEARITATLAGQWNLVNQFAAGVDVYSDFASDIYNVKVTKETHPHERFVGKTAILSLGFMASTDKFFYTMNDVYKKPIKRDEAYRVVDGYRRKYPRIPQLWTKMQDAINAMANGVTLHIGPLTTAFEEMTLPTGMPLVYPGLSKLRSAYKSMYGKPVTLYSGKLLENCVQALARIVMSTAELRLARHGLRAAMSVHDELVFVVKESHAALVAEVVRDVMQHKVAWMPRLPVAVEVNTGRTYKECK